MNKYRLICTMDISKLLLYWPTETIYFGGKAYLGLINEQDMGDLIFSKSLFDTLENKDVKLFFSTKYDYFNGFFYCNLYNIELDINELMYLKLIS